VELPREAWAALAHREKVHLDQGTLDRLRGLGDPTRQIDLQEVYLPLTQLINLHRHNTARLHGDANKFLHVKVRRTPYVIGIAGSVAVGKSTFARLLRELLSRSAGHPRVELVATDGFLHPNAVLQQQGLLQRKGFPESYDRRALLKFVMDVKSGHPEVTTPVYSHITYDIVPGEQVVVRSPDILIVEGLNVLQPARRHSDGRPALAVSDFFDFSVYVDAAQADIRRWYVDRFLALRQTAFTDPHSYFRSYAHLSDDEAIATANRIWDTINGPNLEQNIEPTKPRATVILTKAGDHEVQHVRIRKV
jgi:type I pantothenate kinase